jgi:uncharacterized protein
VTWLQAILVFAAGIAAGTINTIVGSGTLITFPVLLSIGIPPVTANVTNSLGLAPGALVGAYGYRRELVGQRQRIIALISASLIGAVIGAALLLTLPASAFKAIVPILVGLAIVLVIIGPFVSRRLADSPRRASAQVTVPAWLATLATGVYGGYFGAAQGVLLIGFLGVLLDETLQRLNALKNLLAGLVNLLAAIVFILTTNVDYKVAGVVAAGSIIGGLIGARVGRRLSPLFLRIVIIIVGLVAIAKLVL